MPHQYEGMYTHFTCEVCGEMTEFEGDLRNEMATCSNCGLEDVVEGS